MNILICCITSSGLNDSIIEPLNTGGEQITKKAKVPIRLKLSEILIFLYYIIFPLEILAIYLISEETSYLKNCFIFKLRVSS